MWEGYETGRTAHYDMDRWERYLARLGEAITWLTADVDEYTGEKMESVVDFMHEYWRTIDRDTLILEVRMLCSRHDHRSPEARFTLTDRYYEFLLRSMAFFEEKKVAQRLLMEFLERVTVFAGPDGDLTNELPSPYHELALEGARYLEDYDPVLIDAIKKYNTGRFQEPIRGALRMVRMDTLAILRERFGQRAV